MMNEARESGRGRDRSFEFLTATSADPVVLLDLDGKLLRVGDRAAGFLGRPAHDLEGREAETLLEADDRFAFRKALSVVASRESRAERGDEPVRVRADVPRPGREPVPMELRLRALPEDDGLLVLALRDRSGRVGGMWHSSSPFLASTLDAAADGLLALDLEGNLVFFNERFADIWDLPDRLRRDADQQEVLEHAWRRLRDPEAHRSFTRELRHRPEGEHRDVLELADGQVVQRHVRPRRVDGRMAGWVATYRDVTGEVEAKGALEASEERYRLLFEHNVAGVFKISLDGRILEVNRAFAEMFGYGDPGALEDAPAEDLYADPAERSRFQSLLRREGSVRNFELECVRSDGSSIWLLENSVLMDDPGTGDEVVVGTVIDISRRKKLERELERMAYHDSLTGLPNRRLLREHAGQALAMADRGGHKLGLVYLDLARFKEVNDTLGHDAGDEVLRVVAHRLDTHLREADMAARVGGDEFAVMLSEVSGGEGAMAAASRLRRIFREPIAVKGHGRRLDARLGVALYPDHATDFDALLTAADHAMYRVRSETRAGVGLYDPAADARRPAPPVEPPGGGEAGDDEPAPGHPGDAAGRG